MNSKIQLNLNLYVIGNNALLRDEDILSSLASHYFN
jgi:hypothetical protein